LMLHYSRKKDTLKSIYYADLILKTIPCGKKLLRFEVTTLSSTLKKYTDIVKDKNKAIALLNQAIELQEKYATDFATKAFPFVLNKANLLYDSKLYDEATQVLVSIEKNDQKEDISSQFRYVLLKGKVEAALQQKEQALTNFDAAFSLL